MSALRLSQVLTISFSLLLISGRSLLAVPQWRIALKLSGANSSNCIQRETCNTPNSGVVSIFVETNNSTSSSIRQLKPKASTKQLFSKLLQLHWTFLQSITKFLLPSSKLSSLPHSNVQVQHSLYFLFMRYGGYIRGMTPYNWLCIVKSQSTIMQVSMLSLNQMSSKTDCLSASLYPTPGPQQRKFPVSLLIKQLINCSSQLNFNNMFKSKMLVKPQKRRLIVLAIMYSLKPLVPSLHYKCKKVCKHKTTLMQVPAPVITPQGNV